MTRSFADRLSFHAGRRSASRRRGFTVPELLCVVALMVILLAMLLPTMKRARLQARRTGEVSDSHQVVMAILNFSVDRTGNLPVGTTATAGSWSWTNKAPWKILQKEYGLPKDGDVRNFGCIGWSRNHPGTDYWYNESDGAQWHVPWIYWGNRPDEASFKTIKKRHSTQDATSLTLISCYARQSNSAYSSQVPHIDVHQDVGQIYGAGLVWTPPDILCVGQIDGSAKFMPFTEMKGFSDGGGTSRFFYAPR